MVCAGRVTFVSFPAGCWLSSQRTAGRWLVRCGLCWWWLPHKRVGFVVWSFHFVWVAVLRWVSSGFVWLCNDRAPTIARLCHDRALGPQVTASSSLCSGQATSWVGGVFRIVGKNAAGATRGQTNCVCRAQDLLCGTKGRER